MAMSAAVDALLAPIIFGAREAAQATRLGLPSMLVDRALGETVGIARKPRPGPLLPSVEHRCRRKKKTEPGRPHLPHGLTGQQQCAVDLGPARFLSGHVFGQIRLPLMKAYSRPSLDQNALSWSESLFSEIRLLFQPAAEILILRALTH